MTTAEARHTATILDTIWMRLVALCIAAAGIVLFVVVNQHIVAGWFGADTADEPSAYTACLDERMEAVEQLAEEANYTVKQKELAVLRAQEYCANQTGV